MNKIYYYILAIRPHTLILSFAPVLLAVLKAVNHGCKDYFIISLLFFTAVLLQILANIINDIGDFKNGVDRGEHSGFKRVSALGLIKEKYFILFIILVLLTVIFLGFILVMRGGFIILIIGVSSIFFAFSYTLGKRSLSKTGLADFVVFIFFGTVPVLGSYYLLLGKFDIELLILSFSFSFISLAFLSLNNMRDIKKDSIGGRKTLAVRFGKKFILKEICYSLFLSFLIPILYFLYLKKYVLSLILIIGLLWIVKMNKDIAKSKREDLNAFFPKFNLLLLFLLFIFISYLYFFI